MRFLTATKLFFSVFIIITALVLMIKTNYSLPTNTPAIKKKVIIIDPGHGNPDGGASSAEKVKEKDINLSVAKKLKAILEKEGAKVILTRKNDNSLSTSITNNKSDDLNKRKNIIRKSNADIFVSIHMNHFGDSKYYGAQVFYNDTNSENHKLASSIQKNLIKYADKTNTRTEKADNSLYILKNNQMPSVLIECGFLSNESEAHKLTTAKYQNKLAKAIYMGIDNYLYTKNKVDTND